MVPDRETCLAAVTSRDARFDGTFFTGVTSTGIYCRPSCPARTPAARNMTFHPSAAAAQAAGFRACKRCRPDAVPGSPEWDIRGDLTARAMRLIGDGVIDREGVAGLADRLGYSVRQVQRLTLDELGASPVALARTQRAHTARLLVQTTDLPLTQVAFAAGFGSLRSFNDTIRCVYATTPSALRAQRPANRHGQHADRLLEVSLRLAVRLPFDPSNVFGHLVATAVPGVEEWRDGAYRRTLRLPHGPGFVALAPRPDHVAATLHLTDPRDLTPAIGRCRRLLDLDADPRAVDGALAQDPALAPLVAASPGRRVPRTVDGDEFAVRAVLGQQVSTAAARTHAARLVEAYGDPVVDPVGGLTHLFPTAAALTNPARDCFAGPDSRFATLVGLTRALASGGVDLSPGADRDAARAALAALRGIGPWTVEMIAMRSLGDPDAFPASDLGVVKGAQRLGVDAVAEAAQRWRPWRAYATQHLWAAHDHPINRLPTEDS
ncbi:MAG: AlkA N-terminal domain-containing protein [Propionibacteriaceae bacterium]|nr:AlkA N-terminal domain-containing protein [Propionibacteriaceae bacterium]